MESPKKLINDEDFNSVSSSGALIMNKTESQEKAAEQAQKYLEKKKL